MFTTQPGLVSRQSTKGDENQTSSCALKALCFKIILFKVERETQYFKAVFVFGTFSANSERFLSDRDRLDN